MLVTKTYHHCRGKMYMEQFIMHSEVCEIGVSIAFCSLLLTAVYMIW